MYNKIWAIKWSRDWRIALSFIFQNKYIEKSRIVWTGLDLKKNFECKNCCQFFVHVARQLGSVGHWSGSASSHQVRQRERNHVRYYKTFQRNLAERSICLRRYSGLQVSSGDCGHLQNWLARPLFSFALCNWRAKCASSYQVIIGEWSVAIALM